jgi:light-regulated signal transduction histidine kinase (bacteriophytochrome)
MDLAYLYCMSRRNISYQCTQFLRRAQREGQDGRSQFDDTSQSFSGLLADSAHSELGAAMTRVLTQLRLVRSEREEQARYFQTLIAHVPVAFFTTKRQGSGVGLTLVRQIATAHGAAVDLSSTPGGGATVSLRFLNTR